MKKILVLNAGSSSLKYKLFIGLKAVLSGVIENIEDYHSGILRVEVEIERAKIKRLSDLDLVAHRVVHGGDIFKKSVLIDEEVIKSIQSLIPLAPLHNPANLEGIITIFKEAPSLKQVAVFDTAFHQTVPEHAHTYPIPRFLYEKGIRKYGFHGTSHRFVAKEASKILGKRLEDVNLITLHLGNGSSLCAIKNGESIDTTMGFTPLEGLMMGTRSGDIDVAILFYLHKELGYSLDEMDEMLNKKSGFIGICNQNDIRIVHKMIENGDSFAKKGLDMFVYRIKKYIGAYYVVLNGEVDALVFTGGIGENDEVTRDLIVKGLPFDIPTLVVKTDEELEIAKEANRFYKREEINDF